MLYQLSKIQCNELSRITIFTYSSAILALKKSIYDVTNTIHLCIRKHSLLKNLYQIHLVCHKLGRKSIRNIIPATLTQKPFPDLIIYRFKYSHSIDLAPATKLPAINIINMITIFIREALGVGYYVAGKILIHTHSNDMLLSYLIIGKIKQNKQQQTQLNGLCLLTKHYK